VTRRSVPPTPPEPTERERALAKWVGGDSERLALFFARYREELLAPFVEMRIDYDALGDVRVAEDLNRLLVMARGTP